MIRRIVDAFWFVLFVLMILESRTQRGVVPTTRDSFASVRSTSL
jgi:hypothetical protein